MGVASENQDNNNEMQSDYDEVDYKICGELGKVIFYSDNYRGEK